MTQQIKSWLGMPAFEELVPVVGILKLPAVSGKQMMAQVTEFLPSMQENQMEFLTRFWLVSALAFEIIQEVNQQMENPPITLLNKGINK